MMVDHPIALLRNPSVVLHQQRRNEIADAFDALQVQLAETGAELNRALSQIDDLKIEGSYSHLDYWHKVEKLESELVRPGPTIAVTLAACIMLSIVRAFFGFGAAIGLGIALLALILWLIKWERDQ